MALTTPLAEMWWLYTFVILPAYISIQAGFIAANVLTYRGLVDRACRDFQQLPRSVANLKDIVDSEVWMVLSPSDIERTAEEMRKIGYIRAARFLDATVRTLSETIQTQLAALNAECQAFARKNRYTDDQFVDYYIRKQRATVRKVLAPKIESASKEIIQINPEILAILDMPSFARAVRRLHAVLPFRCP